MKTHLSVFLAAEVQCLWRKPWDLMLSGCCRCLVVKLCRSPRRVVG